jgi:hypothetical protein
MTSTASRSKYLESGISGCEIRLIRLTQGIKNAAPKGGV